MNFYMCGQLRKMLDGFAALNAATARDLLSPQQLVQVIFFAPAAQRTDQPCTSSSQASTSSGVVGAV
eukprot:4495855-Pleurochrysis_carterae.AAC.1